MGGGTFCPTIRVSALEGRFLNHSNGGTPSVNHYQPLYRSVSRYYDYHSYLLVTFPGHITAFSIGVALFFISKMVLHFGSGTEPRK